VSALGRLEPSGDVRRLAAPITGIGGSPRITELLVEEGQPVQAGQLLARFDTGPTLRAEQRLLQSRIANLSAQVTVQDRDNRRYRQLARAGATPASDLENRELKLIELQGSLREARDQLAKTEADLVNTELRAPIDGTVLRLISRVGERPGDDGILELGASDRMEVVAEVYESDIGRVRPGQEARITSENGGFSGTLRGRVVRIRPQVRQREVLSTDPTGDADARVVEVRLALDPADARRVRSLVGLKTVIRFEP
jgi:HlyD family secretion protein